MLDVLGMACAELGRFDDAQKAAQEAINLAKASGMTNDAVVVQQRLRLYQKPSALAGIFFCPPNPPPGNLPEINRHLCSCRGDKIAYKEPHVSSAPHGPVARAGHAAGLPAGVARRFCKLRTIRITSRKIPSCKKD